MTFTPRHRSKRGRELELEEETVGGGRAMKVPGARTCSPEGGYPADIPPPEESSGWIFHDVRMEQVLVSLFIGQKGTHTAD